MLERRIKNDARNARVYCEMGNISFILGVGLILERDGRAVDIYNSSYSVSDTSASYYIVSNDWCISSIWRVCRMCLLVFCGKLVRDDIDAF